MEQSTSSSAPQQLTLVAPMPRRPIALVARRHHHHHHHHASKSRGHRSAASRSGSIDEAMNQAASPTSPDRALPPSRFHSLGHSSHPYSRRSTTTPTHSSSSGSTTTSPSSTSPYLQDSAIMSSGAFKSPSKERSSRVRKSLQSAIESLEEAAALTGAHAAGRHTPNRSTHKADDDAMSVLDEGEEQPHPSKLETTGRASQDVERTPTKTKDRRRLHDPASTPTADASCSDQPDCDATLCLSPRSPNTQRLHAHAQLSASVASSLSATASPSLSPSRSRSPSTSPSPCPSPSYRPHSAGSATSDSSNPNLLCAWSFYEDEGFSIVSSRRQSTCSDGRDSDKDGSGQKKDPSTSQQSLTSGVLLAEQRKLGLPLPIPTSPIPRRMTRNPFERFLCVDLDLSLAGGCGRRSLDADRDVFLSQARENLSSRRSVHSPSRLPKSRTALGLFTENGNRMSYEDGDGDGNDVPMKDGASSRANSTYGSADDFCDAPSVMDED